MSRLQSYQKKNTIKQIVFITIIVVGILVFLFTSGLQFIINTTLFINQLANSNKNTVVKPSSEKQVLSDLTLDPPPNGTNSAEIKLSGALLNYDLLEVYVNKEKVEDKEVIGDSFSFTIDGLKKGNNQIYLIAKSSSRKETKKSQIYTVMYDNEKPKLEISYPSDRSTLKQEDVMVKGATEPEVFIRVQGLPAVVDSRGNFQMNVRLHTGENQISVTAEDLFGNTEKKDIVVTYQKEE